MQDFLASKSSFLLIHSTVKSKLGLKMSNKKIIGKYYTGGGGEKYPQSVKYYLNGPLYYLVPAITLMLTPGDPFQSRFAFTEQVKFCRK
jgi:hypothetical protein